MTKKLLDSYTFLLQIDQLLKKEELGQISLKQEATSMEQKNM